MTRDLKSEVYIHCVRNENMCNTTKTLAIYLSLENTFVSQHTILTEQKHQMRNCCLVEKLNVFWAHK
jgi:hypothetical protein